ncbi:MAG: Putative Lipopolysaccharide biosynthesis protein [Nitrospira sp.]|nr:MAG: Putative Lipopolysaccharide biosynthesis protein [Nitrospira sp.]
MFTGLSTPEEYFRAIKNHKWLIIVPIVVCVGVAALICYWLPKSYRSSTLLYFQEQKVRGVKGVDAPESGGETQRPDVAMGTRIDALREVLYKRELLTQVADEFHLYGYDKDNAAPALDNSVSSRLRSLVTIEPQGSGLLKVSFADVEPTIAKAVTARLADLFVRENTKSRTAIAESSTEFLQHEMDSLKGQLESKEQAIARFKQSHLGQLPEQMDSNMRAIDRLESEVSAQQEMEKTLSLRVESVDKALREYEDPSSDVSPRRAEKDPRLVKIRELERTLAGFRSMYKETYPDVARVKNELNQLQSMTTEEYIALYIEPEAPEIDGPKKARRKQIDPYKAELLKQREDLLREVELVHRRQARIAEDIRKYESRIQGTTVHQQELMSIQRDYENLQRNYQSLLEKKLAVGMAGNLEQKQQGTQMRIVEPAGMPSWPEKPNLMVVMLGGLAVGCALGFGSAFGIEMLRRGFVSAEEIEVTLGVPVFATISHFESAWPGGVKLTAEAARHKDRLLALPGFRKEGLLVANGGSTAGCGQVSVGPELVAMWYPRSPVAEQYRVAATRIGLMAGQQESTVIVMASALMGEGKTSTALNLAHVLARDLNKKTVLVDCDLKRPMVHAYAGMELGVGLSEVLLGEKQFEECLEYHEQLGIWILPAGIIQSGIAALTHVDRLSKLISNLREKFECIVLDAPPLLPVAESLLIVRMADVVAQVIRARTTPRDAVMNAMKMVGQERAMGVILNGVEEQDSPYSYYSYGNKAYEPHRTQLR